ncbi:DNA methyltransferase [Candidatus Pacearchaeota archaeon CG10_big_fil_rev_8_21_14_0_10_32_14]|nr:MAG: DNA methyltransferase [Candidatus Pacearchaeota archaeon CG10_big_fil_rev_8_21_14_0_10_32_14]
MTFYSPLRYPGGKAKLVGYFKDLITQNGIKGGTYVEIYAGGASIALSLLIEGYVSKVIINDNDKSIYALWYSILNHPRKLCNLIKKTPLTIENWRIQKEIQKNKDKHDLLTLGFSTFFLNRTNRSGIINAGVIGGLNQDGKWKMDARFNKENLISKIKLIAKYKHKIKLHNLDAVRLIRKIKNQLPKKSLIYLDPPYYYKGKELYMNYYDYESHKEISEVIKKVTKVKWVITYDDVGEINHLYKGFDNYSYLLNYSAANSGKGKEIIIFSSGMNHSSEGLILTHS